MIKWVLRAVLAAAIIALGVWAWKVFFPNPEHAIRKRLQEAARVTSFSPGESPIAKVAAVQKLMALCTDDIEIAVDVQGFARQTLSGRDELQQTALAARAHLSALHVDFLDTTVELGPNKQSAVVNLTAKIRVPSEQQFFPQELKFTMKKLDGKWLIRKIETVRTLLP